MNTRQLAEQFREEGFCRIEGLFGPAELADLDAKTREVIARAAGIPGENEVFDVEDSHTPDDPRIRRIKRPHEVDPLYWSYACFPKQIGRAHV